MVNDADFVTNPKHQSTEAIFDKLVQISPSSLFCHFCAMSKNCAVNFGMSQKKRNKQDGLGRLLYWSKLSQYYWKNTTTTKCIMFCRFFFSLLGQLLIGRKEFFVICLKICVFTCIPSSVNLKCFALYTWQEWKLKGGGWELLLNIIMHCV